jgi:hypothetical protein
MPNWCYNSLCVSGNKEILADFVSKTLVPCNMSSEEEYDESHRFTFNILHPTPKALEGNTSPLRKLEGEDDTQFKERMAENVRLYGAEDWYRWHLDNWGTKWDAKSTSVEQLDDTNFNVQFHTAWSPPTTLYENMVEDGWEVRALYHEPGMVFIGSYEDGFDDYYEYDITDRESIENLPEQLIDYGNLMEEHENWIEENKDETEMD